MTAKHDAFATDLSILNCCVRPNDGASANCGVTFQNRKWLNLGIRLDLNVGFDKRRVEIDNGHAIFAVPLQDASAHHVGNLRQLVTVVNAPKNGVIGKDLGGNL